LRYSALTRGAPVRIGAFFICSLTRSAELTSLISPSLLLSFWVCFTLCQGQFGSRQWSIIDNPALRPSWPFSGVREFLHYLSPLFVSHARLTFPVTTWSAKLATTACLTCLNKQLSQLNRTRLMMRLPWKSSLSVQGSLPLDKWEKKLSPFSSAARHLSAFVCAGGGFLVVTRPFPFARPLSPDYIKPDRASVFSFLPRTRTLLEYDFFWLKVACGFCGPPLRPLLPLFKSPSPMLEKKAIATMRTTQ